MYLGDAMIRLMEPPDISLIIRRVPYFSFVWLVVRHMKYLNYI